MAITPIRQKREAFTKRIGVINVDTGASEVAQTVQRVAADIDSNLDPFLRQNALERGTNVAKEVTRQNLVTFDDKGEPIAMTVPKQFGLVASQAYNAVIERRFEDTMLDEINNKSIEIAKKYPSPAAYNKMMSKYLNDMDAASSGRFKQFISENGKEVFTKTLGKLQVAAQAAALKSAKQSANLNVYNALKKLEMTKALGYSADSLDEVNKAIGVANAAIEEKFRLYKDPLERQKDLDLLNQYKAGAGVNMLTRDIESLSSSQRAIVTEAIKNPAMLGSIDDPKIRNAVEQIQKDAGYLGLDDLSKSFDTSVNALGAIEKFEESEWLTSNQARIDRYTTSTFPDVTAAIAGSRSLVQQAPDQDKATINNHINNQVADVFERKINEHILANNLGEYPSDGSKISGHPAVESLRNQIQAALSQEQTSGEIIDRLPKTIGHLVVQAINHRSTEDRQSIIANINNYLNPELAAIKYENDVTKGEIDLQNARDQAESLEQYYTIEGGITEAIEAENFDNALKLFNSINPANLPQTELNKYNAQKASLADKMKRLGNTKALKELTKSEAENINGLIDKLENTSTVATAIDLEMKIRNGIEGLAGTHSPDTKASWLSKVTSNRKRIISDDQNKSDMYYEREADALLAHAQSVANSGIPFYSSQLDSYIKDYTDSYKKKSDWSQTKLNESINKLKSFYATSAARFVFADISSETGGKGINPNRLKEIIRLAQAGTALTQAELENLTGAELVIGKKLIEAFSAPTAKSEVRTQLNAIEEQNLRLFNDNQTEIELQNTLERVDRLGHNAKLDDLKTWEEEKLNPLAGVGKGQVIDYGNPDLLRNKNGELTPFAVELRAAMQRGIVPPNLATYMNNAAELGTVSSQNVFELFNMGSNSSKQGLNLNIFRMENSPLSSKALARFGAAAIRYEAGQSASLEDAFAEIVSTANQIGKEGIAGSIKAIIATKDNKDKTITEWVNETYPTADALTRAQLVDATIALGADATSVDDLKNRIKIWSARVFGEDSRVVGNRLEAGSKGLDLVRGARSKFLTNQEMKVMDAFALRAMYESLSGPEQQRLFSPYAYTVDNVYTADQINVLGQTMFAQFDLKYRQQFDGSSMYMLMVQTDMGLSPLRGKDNLPIYIDAMTFKEQPNVLDEVGYYQTNWRAASQQDPNGLKYTNESWFESAAQLIGGRIISDYVSGFNKIPEASQKTIDAEQALIFARFPERLNDPKEREEFERLVKNGTILKEHRESFLRFVND